MVAQGRRGRDGRSTPNRPPRCHQNNCPGRQEDSDCGEPRKGKHCALLGPQSIKQCHVKSVADDQTVEHPQQSDPGYFESKQTADVALTEAQGTQHSNRPTSLADVANRDHSDASHTNHQAQRKVALEQRQNGQHKGLNHHDLLGHCLNIDVLCRQSPVQDCLQFQRCSSCGFILALGCHRQRGKTRVYR